MKTIYKSELAELASKEFESVEELEKAEAEVNEKVAAKQKAAEVRKTDSEAVKQAIIAKVEVEKKALQMKADAYKEYLKVIEEADKQIEEAKEAQEKALDEFCTKYPDGFHDTIKIGDVTYRYNYAKESAVKLPSLFDVFKYLW